MGFKVKRKIYRLKFQDPEMAGLEVEARGLSVGQLLELEEARMARAAGGAGSEGATRRMLRLFSDALVSWNAEDEDTGLPIPPTAEGIKMQDSDFLNVVIDAWNTAMAGVDAPLSPTSSDGQPSLEASIPMDVPSESLAS